MRTLRIVAFGLLGVTAVLAFVTIHLWREGARRKEGLKALRELTPERLIANCGQPSSDTEPMVLDMKAGTVTVNVTGANVKSAGERVAIARTIEYRGTTNPYWVKFEFNRDVDNKLQPTRWHLIHFVSTGGEVSPFDENANLAIPVFPCMDKRTP
jgi:hypothetical protein